MNGDLFGDFAAELDDAQPVPPVATLVEPAKRDPTRTVASFSCIICGAIDEVLEPAPEWVTCWSPKCGTQMHRFRPPHEPPHFNARALTGEEMARLASSRWGE